MPCPRPLDGGLRCILFTDFVGWSKLAEQVGGDAADVLGRQHFDVVRTALTTYRGQEIKTAGGRVVATFRSALDALQCAATIQTDVAGGDELRVRIGVHAETMDDDDDGDVFGTAMKVASRLCSAAAPGEIVVSDLTRSLVAGRGGFTFDSSDPIELNGLREPMHVSRLRVAGQPRWPRSGTSAPPAANPFRPVQPMLCPVIVGRERELGLLEARLKSALGGMGSVVGLIGDAGVGKTRLCREVADRAADAGWCILAGRAVPGDTPVPYRPLTEALVGAFRDGPPPGVPELAGFRGHVARLVPAWQTDETGGADESPVLLGEAVVRMLRVVGNGRGCVLILEDLHWADPETLSVVEYLIDSAHGERLLAVCTSRGAGAATDLWTRLQRRDPGALIGIEPLPADGVAQVVSACLATTDPPQGVLSLVTSHSEGNPFFVEELLAGLVASSALTFEHGQWVASHELAPSVPFSFGDSIRQRLASLDTTARRVLSAAAVLGRRFDWDLLPGVAEVDGRAVLDALRRGVDEQLIEVEGRGFKFRHALTREAMLRELLPPERRDLASRAWPAVERANPGLPGPWCELAAELAEAAGDPAAAAARLVESASRALRSAAFNSAEATLAKAVRLADGDRAITDDAEGVLVQTLALAGKPEQANAIGTALVDRLSEAHAPAHRRAGLLVVLARASIIEGDHDAARGFSDRARVLVDGGEVDDAVAARVEAVAAHVALAQARLEDAEELARSAIERAASTAQPDVECEAIEVVGRIERTRDFDMSQSWFQHSAQLAERHGLTTWLIRARSELAGADWRNGRTRTLTEVRDFAARHGALVTVAHMDLSLADFALGSFDRQACLEAAQRCVEASRRYRLSFLPVAELWLAGAHALAGDEPAMEQAAARGLEHDPDDPRILGDLWGRVRATFAAVRDDRPRLRTALDNQMPFTRVAPVTTSIFPNRILWALLCTIHDDDLGEPARQEIRGATNLTAWPQFGAALEMMEAIADGRAGRTTQAADRFGAVYQELMASPIAAGTMRFYHLLVAEAAIRDGWGDPATWLRASEAFFTDAGFDVIARRCRALLAQVGAAVPRRRGATAVPSSLRALGVTGRETDVLRLVAARRSNREIAEALILSPKTVERHIASLFDRTGIRNRGDLGTYARSQPGWDPPLN